MRTLTVLLLALLMGLHGIAQAAERVLMIVPDGSRDLELMLGSEIGTMRRMLGEAGYAVDVATATDAPMVAGKQTLEPDVLLAQVDVSDYAGVLLPCMAPARGTEQPAIIDDIVRDAHARGIPLAASRGSVATLARAGVLADRDYAYAGPVDPARRPEFAGGRFLGTTVVSSGGVSTAGICPLAAHELGEPDGTATLTRSFIRDLQSSR